MGRRLSYNCCRASASEAILNTPNPRYIFPGGRSIKTSQMKYPCFCLLPLEFGVNIDIHKHENSEVPCWNCNKFWKEMSGDSTLQIHGKHVNRFHLTAQAKCLVQTILYHLNTFKPRQNGRHFADDTFKCIFLNENSDYNLTVVCLRVQLTIFHHWFR